MVLPFRGNVYVWFWSLQSWTSEEFSNWIVLEPGESPAHQEPNWKKLHATEETLHFAWSVFRKLPFWFRPFWMQFRGFDRIKFLHFVGDVIVGVKCSNDYDQN